MHQETAWWGGEVSLDPFVQSLHHLVLERGYRSRACFAKALDQSPSTLSRWYRSDKVPSPENFGRILILLDPNEEARESLVSAYASLIEQGKGVPAEKITHKVKLKFFYNGAEVGRELGISRERVRQLRNKFGLPLLRMTDEHIEMLRKMGYGS